MVYFFNPWAFKIIQNLFTDCVYQFNYSHAKPHPITLGGVPHDFTIFVLFLSEPMCWWPSTRFQKLSIPILTIAWYITLCSRITGPTSDWSASGSEQNDESPKHRQNALGGGRRRRCQLEGCPNFSQGSTRHWSLCKSHGGGKRCQHNGCLKSAQGITWHCIAHGGGTRCQHEGWCPTSARGSTGHCAAHGGR